MVYIRMKIFWNKQRMNFVIKVLHRHSSKLFVLISFYLMFWYKLWIESWIDILSVKFLMGFAKLYDIQFQNHFIKMNISKLSLSLIFHNRFIAYHYISKENVKINCLNHLLFVKYYKVQTIRQFALYQTYTIWILPW